MAQSKLTKHYKNAAIITAVLSGFLLLLPLAIYIVKGFVEGEPQQKLSLGISITVSGILLALNIACKLHLRSILWILVLGINMCISNIQTLLIIMAVTTIVDELIIAPMHKYYASRAIINGEIDKRM